MTTNDCKWYNEWQLVTKSDNQWWQVRASDSKWQRAVISVKDLFSLHQKLLQTIATDLFKIFKFIYSLSFDVPLACLCINDVRELCKRYPQLTTGHCIEMRSGTSAVHIFFIWSNQFYISNVQFQINVGSFGATDVTKYFKLSKITNFLRLFWYCSKNCCFSQLSLVANNVRVITNVEGVGVRFFCYNQFWRSI